MKSRVAARIQVNSVSIYHVHRHCVGWAIVSGHHSSRIGHHFVRRSLIVSKSSSAPLRLAHHCWIRFILHFFRPPLLVAGSSDHLQLVAFAHPLAARLHFIALPYLHYSGLSILCAVLRHRRSSSCLSSPSFTKLFDFSHRSSSVCLLIRSY